VSEETEEVNDIAKPFAELTPHLGNTPVAAAHAIASIALSMAMKYHDIATIKDGALYQQYKLEGKNLIPLHLDMVFETAIKLEAHLLGSSARIAALVIDAIAANADDEEDASPHAPEGYKI
jgi:hypothetical protein